MDEQELRELITAVKAGRGSRRSFMRKIVGHGLTVPFALTAGLSSLGSTRLVVIGGLAELFSGMISMAGAVLKVVITFVARHDVGQLASSLALFLVGLWSFRAAASFAAMATTDSADQRHLMEGLGLLRRVFLLQVQRFGQHGAEAV